jgi:hypothetical protein
MEFASPKQPFCLKFMTQPLKQSEKVINNGNFNVDFNAVQIPIKFKVVN